jgi:hypothetical protein
MRTSQHVPKSPLIGPDRTATRADLSWRFPDRRFDEDAGLQTGPAVCARCHAFIETDHWRYDPHHAAALRAAGVRETLCPGCTRLERRIYEGEVTIRHDWSVVGKDEVLHLARHQEAQARGTNPTARIALSEDRGDSLYLLTTNRFLARRIGIALHKAYRGALKVDDLPRERFTRVRWER